MKTEERFEWKVNTAGLIKEAVEHNPTMWGMVKPFEIFRAILVQVGERASELNDPILNGLMCRLAIYEISDPTNVNYNVEILNSVMEKYNDALNSKNK